MSIASDFAASLDALYASSSTAAPPTVMNGSSGGEVDLAAEVSEVLRRRYTLEQEAQAARAAVSADAPADVLDTLQSLDIEAIERAIAATRAQVERVDGELETMRVESVARDRVVLPELCEAGSSIDAIGRGMGDLVSSAGETAAMAEKVSSRVKAVDAQRARVAETLERMDELLGLEQSSDVVSKAMETSDFESAVSHVQRLREASERPGGAPVEPSMLAKMREVQSSLRAQVQRELDAALEASRLPSLDDAAVKAAEAKVSRFCRLLGPLGQPELGEELFTSFCTEQLRAIVNPPAAPPAAAAEPASPATPSLQPGSSKAAVAATSAFNSFSDLPVPIQLSKVLQRSAALCTAARQVLDEAMGGRAAQQRCALAVRATSVELASTLSARFSAAAQVRSRTADAARRMAEAKKMAEAHGSSGGLAEVGPDVEKATLEAEPLLDEVAAILRGATQYDAFMAQLVPREAAPLSLRAAEPMVELSHGMATLARALAWVSVHKAVRLDATEEAKREEEAKAREKEGGGEPLGGGGGGGEAARAVVDNVFYVLQRMLRRAAHCCDAHIGGAAVEAAAELLHRPLVEQLSRPLKQTMTGKLTDKLAGAALAGATAIVNASADAESAAAQTSSTVGAAALVGAADRLAVSAAATARQAALLRALNALHTCSSYAPKLWQQARDDFVRELPSPQAHGAVVAKLDAAAAVEGALRAALDDGLGTLAASLLPRLKLRLEAFGTAELVLESEAAFTAAANDSFVSGYLAELEALLKALRPSLAPDVLDALLQLFIKSGVERLEVLLLAKRLDQWGAQQLDRDVRALQSRLTELSSRSVRHQLARLSQMTTLLNLEREAELAELWREPGFGWLLSADEARQVLALRVDFRRDAIAQLALD